MDEPDVGEPPTVDPVATVKIEDVIKYLKNVSSTVFEEDSQSPALNQVMSLPDIVVYLITQT